MNVTNSTNDGVDKNPDGLPVSFTPRTLYILECVSLSLAIASVVAAVIAFYWFVRMRRTFRQEYVPLVWPAPARLIDANVVATASLCC